MRHHLPVLCIQNTSSKAEPVASMLTIGVHSFLFTFLIPELELFFGMGLLLHIDRLKQSVKISFQFVHEARS